MDSAEEIAKVISDIKSGRAKPFHNDDKENDKTNSLVGKLFDLDKFMPGTIEVVDSTLLYQNMRKAGKPIALYEDHEIPPVWKFAMIGYVNEHGNVKVVGSVVIDVLALDEDEKWQPKDQEHTIDWSEIRWVYLALVWVGGTSKTNNRRFPTTGPVYAWQIAVREDGSIVDIQWTSLKSETVPVPKIWQIVLLVYLRTITFASATNVVLVEPHRQRHVQKRINRMGVKVRTIHVLPTGKTRRKLFEDQPIHGTVPLTSVRGHYARYGPQFDRGLLFGKIAGKFWIPAHARGDESAGIIQHTYKLEPNDEGQITD